MQELVYYLSKEISRRLSFESRQGNRLDLKTSRNYKNYEKNPLVVINNVGRTSSLSSLKQKQKHQ